MKTVFKIMLGVTLAGVVLIGGCAALVAGGMNEAAKDPQVKAAVADINDVTGKNDHSYRVKMKQIEVGMPKREVVAILGQPRDKQRMESHYGLDESYYYGTWQLNFADGVLDSKNRY